MRARKGPLAGVLFSLAMSSTPASSAADGVVVIAHPDTPSINEDTLQKIYLGKVVEVDGRPIVPVNLSKGNILRFAFMQQVMAQDDDKFTAYWTVRRYIGKGSPPREFSSVREQLEFVRVTPGAVGYGDDSPDTRQGVKMLLKKP